MHSLFAKESSSHGESVLTGGGLPGPVYLFAEAGSALDVAWDLASQGNLPLWGSVLVRSQTAGRGQTRRHWHSPEGNIYATFRLPFEAPFTGTEAAPALGALAVAALSSLGCCLRLKWPNDLVLPACGAQGPRKVGGILLEERHGILCAGMGINVAHAPEAHELRPDHAMTASVLPLPEAVKKCTNVCAETAQDKALSTVESLWAQLVRQMYFWYTKDLPTPFPWQARAEEFLLWNHAQVRLVDGEREVCGTVRGLGPGGELRLAVGGRIEDFLSGSIHHAAGRHVPEGPAA